MFDPITIVDFGISLFAGSFFVPEEEEEEESTYDVGDYDDDFDDEKL